MIQFIDGPATGQHMPLQRTPIMLRVVRSVAGKWDALNHLDDVAEANEDIFLYQLTGDVGWIHIDYVEKETGRRRGRNEVDAKYRHIPNGPTDDVLRDNAKWREWCGANKERILTERNVSIHWPASES